MKKYIALTVAALMAVLCFASCGKNDDPTDPAAPETTVSEETTAEETTVAEGTTVADETTVA